MSRKQKRVFDDAVKAMEDAIRLREGDPDAIIADTRKRIDAGIDARAAKMPTLKRQKIAQFAKRGVHLK
jgi:hypothetical protein